MFITGVRLYSVEMNYCRVLLVCNELSQKEVVKPADAKNKVEL